MDVRKIYPNADEYGYFSAYDYTPIIDALGEVVTREDDNNFQGDTYVLLRSGSAYGIVIFGWGSCSGCDALEACGSYEDLQELADSIAGSVRWFTNYQAAKEWVASAWTRVYNEYDEKDEWRGTDFYVYTTEGQEFVGRVRDYFGLDS